MANRRDKSIGDSVQARMLIDAAVSEADWETIFKKLADKAQEGDIKCASLLLKYRFAQPRKIAAEPGQLPPIHIIEVVRNEPRRTAIVPANEPRRLGAGEDTAAPPPGTDTGV